MSRFLEQYEQFQHQRSPHASQLGPKIRCQQQELLGASNNYNFSSTSARGIEYCYLKACAHFFFDELLWTN
jgi:hypothetical protein